MKNLIIIIAIAMIFILLLGSISKIDNVISDISSDTVTDVSGETKPGGSSSKKYSYRFDLKENGTNKFITTFYLSSDSSSASIYVNSNNDIMLSAADGASCGFDTQNWTNISLSTSTVTPSTSVVYVTYTANGSSGTVTCPHPSLNDDCVCTSCNQSVHSFTDSTGCGAGECYSCISCGAMSNIPVPHAGDNDGDGSCDFCGESV